MVVFCPSGGTCYGYIGFIYAHRPCYSSCLHAVCYGCYGSYGGSRCWGYGIVAQDFDHETVLACWGSSMQPGYSVASLDGKIGHKFSNRASLSPTVPFARMPAKLFQCDWHTLGTGRWHLYDHITAGEFRAHFQCIQALAADFRTHHHRLLLLEDNFPVAASLAKGRATSYMLNFYCRRRAAHNLARKESYELDSEQRSLPTS